MKRLTESDSLHILEDLIAIKSVNNHEKDVALYLQKLLASYNIGSEIINVQGNRANLVAEIGSGAPVLSVCGHMDVVAAGDTADWDSDPFEMTERDGLLFGRGITDMKSGLAASVIAMINLHNAGLPKKGTIRLLATMAEEVGEYGSEAFYQDKIMDDVDGMVIAEPSGYSIGYAEKGSMDIKFISQGKASHASMPENGYNAIDPLVAFIAEANQLFRDENIPTGELGKFTFNTTVINGGIQVNSIPAYAEAEASIRTTPEFDNQRVILEIDKLMRKI
jgi:acetylornithine deacetylase or succinyl-diaminopimelate desuccinylase